MNKKLSSVLAVWALIDFGLFYLFPPPLILKFGVFSFLYAGLSGVLYFGFRGRDEGPPGSIAERHRASISEIEEEAPIGRIPGPQAPSTTALDTRIAYTVRVKKETTLRELIQSREAGTIEDIEVE